MINAAMKETDLAVHAATDTEAFGRLYDLYFPKVYNYVRYRVRDGVLADDLTSRIFTRALTRIGTYRSEKGAFHTWLFTLARNEVNSHWRKVSRKKEYSLELVGQLAEPSDEPERLLTKKESLETLLAAVCRLPNRECDLIGLKFAAGLNNREIARMTGLSESNVGVILFRSLQKLRCWLDEQEKEND